MSRASMRTNERHRRKETTATTSYCNRLQVTQQPCVIYHCSTSSTLLAMPSLQWIHTHKPVARSIVYSFELRRLLTYILFYFFHVNNAESITAFIFYQIEFGRIPQLYSVCDLNICWSLFVALAYSTSTDCQYLVFTTTETLSFHNLSKKKIEMEIAKRRAFVAATKSVARFHRLTPASSSSSNDKIMWTNNEHAVPTKC